MVRYFVTNAWIIVLKTVDELVGVCVGIFETVVVDILVPAGLTTVCVILPNGLLGFGC
jgi:hypothetical protein